MHRNEAAWLAERLGGFEADALSPILDLGSSTREYREVRQPWIETLLFAPLRRRGVRVVHVDSREGEGIDIAADVLDDEDFGRLKALGARTVLCCNMMEHVASAAELARRCLALVPEGGHIFATVPLSYPQHNDPIDTLFRPSPDEAAALFDGAAVVETQVVAVGSYREQVAARPWILVRHVLRFPFPFVDFGKWKRSMTKLRWLWRPYLQSCVVLRKTAMRSPPR